MHRVVELMPYKVQSIGLSDVGLVRHNNEDVWSQLPKKKFFIIADGMGGHQAGEIAAREAVQAICETIESHIKLGSISLSVDEIRTLIVEAIEEANAHVYRMSRRDAELRGMGTTLCCLFFHPKGLIYGHVGDSRIYRLRDNKLLQLTKDHSLLCELLDLGQINERQAKGFIYKNIITKAIGTEPSVQPSVRTSDVLDKDIYLMCTDGLSDLLSHEELEHLIKHAVLRESAQLMVQAAKNKGGHDNITLIIVKVIEKDELVKKSELVKKNEESDLPR